MKKAKKLLSITLIIALMASITVAFTACSEDEVELTFAWWGGDGRANQTMQIIDLFLEQSDDVDYIEGEFRGFADHWVELSARATAGNLPDIVQQDVAHMFNWVENGLLVDLTPFIADNRIDLRNLSQTAIDAGRVTGHPGIYAVPTGMNVAAMIYNASLLQELGLTAPRNMTIDQFVQLSRDIYAASGVRTNWAFNDPLNQLNTHLRANGVALFTGGRMGGNEALYESFFAVIEQGIIEGWHIRPEHMAGREGGEQNALWYPAGDDNANFRAWNSPVWSNMLTNYMNDAPDGVNLDMTTYPSVNPVMGNFGRATMFFAISSHSELQDEAASFISFYMNSPEVHDIVMGDRGVVVNPVIAAHIEPRLPQAAQMQIEFVDWVNNGNSSPYDPTRPGGVAEILSYLQLIIEDLTRLEITPAEAASRLAAADARILG